MLVVVSVAAFWRDAAPAWQDAQEQVRAIVAERLGPERAADVPAGLRQIWIEDLDRVDRCITCHATIDWGPELADAPHPARSHPAIPWLDAKHPISEFGCTLCHGGQGTATTMAAAHGDVAFWEEPLLGSQRAKGYGLEARELMEMACNRCHVHEAEVEGMPLLNDAKAFVKKKNCVRCHTIFGQGTTKAPDLSRLGEKHPTAYTFPKGWKNPRTALHWHIAHFREPFVLVPDTLMPTFLLDGKQAEGLSLLVLSWRKQDLPARYVPQPTR
ncbi:MAG: c-type cytochrome [Planctomycetota bacterium]|nr:c-type cytochrome [Planctomycetota bacterium]